MNKSLNTIITALFTIALATPSYACKNKEKNNKEPIGEVSAAAKTKNGAADKADSDKKDAAIKPSATTAEKKDTPTAEADTSTLATIATINRNANNGAKKPTVYKGNVYGIYVAMEGVAPTETAKGGTQRIMVYKVPLDGSSAAVCQPLQPVPNPLPPHLPGYPNIAGIYAAWDNHCTYTLAIDRSGYIHVSGGMHTSYIHYWRSDAPENISSFTRITEKGGPPPGTTLRKKNKNLPNDGPPPGTPLATPIHPAQRISFPKFMTISSGQLLWTCTQGPGAPLSSYDEKTKLWTPLGGTSPSPKNDRIITLAWEDNAMKHNVGGSEGGLAGFHNDVVFDSKNRMHIVIALLNKDTYSSIARPPSFVRTDILYAYSDDGGKTVFRSNGTQIQLPIRAEAGPNQGEIIIREDADTTPAYQWLSAGISITVDKENRPMIRATSYTTGEHLFRLESGKWVDYPNIALGALSTDPSGVVIGMTETGDFTRFSNPGSKNTESMDAKADGYDRAYYRETGELVWCTLVGTATEATLKVNRTVFKTSERAALRPSPE